MQSTKAQGLAQTIKDLQQTEAKYGQNAAIDKQIQDLQQQSAALQNPTASGSTGSGGANGAAASGTVVAAAVVTAGVATAGSGSVQSTKAQGLAQTIKDLQQTEAKYGQNAGIDKQIQDLQQQYAALQNPSASGSTGSGGGNGAAAGGIVVAAAVVVTAGVATAGSGSVQSTKAQGLAQTINDLQQTEAKYGQNASIDKQIQDLQQQYAATQSLSGGGAAGPRRFMKMCWFDRCFSSRDPLRTGHGRRPFSDS